jgi:hypothetical protein
VETDLAHDLETLHHKAAGLKAEADAAVRTYDRETWIRFVLVFFPVPFIVVLIRLQLEAWGYYVAGGLLLGSAALLFALDSAAAAKRDRAIHAAERAQQAYDQARDGN